MLVSTQTILDACISFITLLILKTKRCRPNRIVCIRNCIRVYLNWQKFLCFLTYLLRYITLPKCLLCLNDMSLKARHAEENCHKTQIKTACRGRDTSLSKPALLAQIPTHSHLHVPTCKHMQLFIQYDTCLDLTFVNQ